MDHPGEEFPSHGDRAKGGSSAGQPPSPEGRLPARALAFFGHDSTESTIIKRATTFQAYGWKVIGFMFKRVRPGIPRSITWENVDLGVTVDLHYLRRVTKLLAALPSIISNRKLLRRCTVFYARNIDMLLLAVLAKFGMRLDATIVYEVLDIPAAAVGSRWLNRAFRVAERSLIGRTKLLVVSSPEFMTEYYFRHLNYHGPWYLLENKVPISQLPANRMHWKEAPQAGPPWLIGWFGTLRCMRSLELLSAIARRLGDRVQIHIRGLASEERVPTSMIKAATDLYSNIVYYGPYVSPRDLPVIYREVHFTWCVDYLDSGANSDWLLPNRIYEGGLMASVALARKNTATGRLVEREGLGFTLDEPLDDAVVTLIDTLSLETYESLRRAIRAREPTLFLDATDTQKLLERISELSEPHPHVPAKGLSAGP